MSLKERVYSVLVVSAAEKLNISLSEILSGYRCDPVRVAKSVSAAKRLLSDAVFDVVIINSPLTDETGIRLAIDTAALRNTVVLLMIPSETFDDVSDKVAEHGVFTIPKPLSRSVFTTAFGWMRSARERLRLLEAKTASVEEKMEEIRLVNRAKWLLISHLGMDEPQAHRYIEKQAMDRCVPRREIAKELIQTYT